MNQDPSNISNTDINPTNSTSTLTKPLNFSKQSQIEKQSQKIHEKEFNSSSDTYISDSESNKNTKEKDESKNQNKFLSNEIINSNNMINNDEMINDQNNLITPSNSTTFNNLNSTYSNNSPSKSIMKNSKNSLSPRKNVAFTNSNPEIHRYKSIQDSSENTSTNQNSSIEEDLNNLNHNWNELDNDSNSSENESNSTPPAPPPHKSDSIHTFHNILQNNPLNNKDIDKETLSKLKLMNKFNDMSLNEKLEIFLTSNSNKDKNHELDDHLNKLNNATKFQTDSNIHYLSLNLQNHQINEIENPLNSLTTKSDHRINSNGSSQSSLQSLSIDNRTLQSKNSQLSNKGIELNDGIKGFPDHLVQSLIPSTTDRLNHEDEDDDDDEFHDSFDNSYNTAEKSILKLLNNPNGDSKLKNEISENPLENPFISKESQENQNLKIKSEHDESNLEQDDVFKSKLNDIIKSNSKNFPSSSSEVKEEPIPIIKSEFPRAPLYSEKYQDEKKSALPKEEPESDSKNLTEEALKEEHSVEPSLVPPQVKPEPKPLTNESVKPEPKPLTNESFMKPEPQPISDKPLVKPEPQSNESLLKSEPEPLTEEKSVKPELQPLTNEEPIMEPEQKLPIKKEPSVKPEPQSLLNEELTTKEESMEAIDQKPIVKKEPVAKEEFKYEEPLVENEPSLKSETANFIKQEPFIKAEPQTVIKPELNETHLTIKHKPSEVILVNSLQDPVVIKSDPETVLIKSETFDPVSVKSEGFDDIWDDEIDDKKIDYDMNNGIGKSFKTDIQSDQDDDENLDHVANTQIESVSYGVSLDPNDLKYIQTKSLNKNVPSNQDINIENSQSDRASINNSNNSYSHDGDNEDNDEEITDNELHTIHHQLEQPKIPSSLPEDSPYSFNDYQDASEEIIPTLAPPRIDEAVDATIPPTPVKRALLKKQEQEKAQQELEKLSETNEEDDALANSSNIAPPDGISLPPIEPSNYSSFEDLAKHLDPKRDVSNNFKYISPREALKNELDADSFEESLSAEHEADPNPTDFISIWHKQKIKAPMRSDIKERFRTPEVPAYKAPVLQTDNQVKLPTSLQQKKFKEVNVMSRRVVSPDFEDLQVSGFLPEISEDSGFSNHFKNLVKNGETSMNISDLSQVSGDKKSMTPLSTRNVLSNMDNDPTLLEPPHPKQSPAMNKYNNGSRFSFTVRNPVEMKGLGITNDPKARTIKPKTSRFSVPSFEIKRSNSILSPKNQYDDIFDDTLKRAPTIKSQGMKTLPSMDRDDVKKILDAKRAISQEEYSRVKYLGQSKKGSIVDEPSDKYDSLQQHASIYDVSQDSSPQLPEQHALPHITSELMKNPTAILAKNHVFNTTQTQVHDSVLEYNNSQDNSAINNSIINNTMASQKDKNMEFVAFPDPDPDLVKSPGVTGENNIFKTPPKNVEERAHDDLDDVEKHAVLDDDIERRAAIDNELEMKYKIINKSPKKPITPKKSGAIKIGSPMRLVKTGSSITGVALDSPTKKARVHKKNNPFRSDETLKYKQSDGSLLNEALLPSTISVPSTSKSSNASSTTLGNNTSHQYRNVLGSSGPVAVHSPIAEENAASPSSQPPQLPQERGRLFLRVVGIKGIELPEIRDHQADFSIYLDNGVHCIKTPSYKLDSNNISINKEFELTVGESLEFIMTMKTNYEKPRGKLVEVRERKVVKSKHRLSRMFGSKNVVTTTKFVPQESNDSWAHKFAQDGSFARCYVDLDQYENQITGRASSFDITCFNEWETYMDYNTKQRIKSQPYRIAQLEVKMLFIPRTDEQEVLPTSIKSAYEGINELRQELAFSHEGYMHQEGGDCEIWKKRFFKLEGTSLIAHSEYSHKTRAKINLAKVVEVIYVDKENFDKTKNNYRNFSDILLVEHAFKIKFANGEIIDFGAPNKLEKDTWISIIEKIVYRNKFRRQPWVKLMLEDEFNASVNHRSSIML